MNNYIKRTLKNGVKLYLYINKNMKKTFVSYMVDYGSNGKYFNFKYKGKEYHVLPGIAHFLEHMLGEHSKYGNMYKIFGSRGYARNGLTGIDYTYYYFTGKNDIKDSIKVLIESIDDPVFTKEDVEETKYAIAEETKRSLNSTPTVLQIMAERNLYKNLDLFHETLGPIGDEKTTYELDYDTLKMCYDAFYYDENKTLVIGGNFDEEEMVEYLESIYANLKPHKKNLELIEYKNLDVLRKKEETKVMPTDDDYVTIVFKNKIKDYSLFEIAFYTDFLLENKFAKKMPKIEQLFKDNIISFIDRDSAGFPVDGYYHFQVDAKVKDKQNKKFIDFVLYELKNEEFSEKDFDLYIRREMAEQAFSLDNKYHLLYAFPRHKKICDDYVIIDKLKELNFKDFLKFYKTIDFDTYTIGTIVKEKDTK